jgi:hypothetical protein
VRLGYDIFHSQKQKYDAVDPKYKPNKKKRSSYFIPSQLTVKKRKPKQAVVKLSDTDITTAQPSFNT